MIDLGSLMEYKAVVRGKVLSHEWPGVVGVGVDAQASVLIVFTLDKASTATLLFEQFGAELDGHYVLVSGKVASGGARRWLGVETAMPSSGLFALPPSSPIKPNPGDLGSLGCFVRLLDNSVGALTVRHCFYGKAPGQNVNACEAINSCNTLGGKSVKLGNLLAVTAGGVNDCDCALFQVNAGTMSPRNDGRLSGGYVSAGSASNATNAGVVNLSSRLSARVIDVDSTITYQVVLGNKGPQGNFLFEDVLLDHQILVQGIGFGVFAESGSPVIMEADDSGGQFQAGDILGLYSVEFTECNFHYLTPLFRCMDELADQLSEKKIYLP
jgi:hypothetical protein